MLHAGLQVDRDEALGVEVVAGAVAAVLVDGRRFDRQIDDAGFGVGGDLRPHADVAGPVPRSVFPRLVTGLAGAGHRVEAPDLLAGAGVEGAHEALDVGAVEIAQALEHRGADDDHVVDDGRRRVQPDFTLLEIDLDLLAVLADHHADLHVDDAVLAEAFDRLAGLGVERDQLIAGGHIDDAIVALAVGPVREAAAGELARSPAAGALALIQAVDPLQLAGARRRARPRSGGCRRWRRPSP